MGTFSRPTYRNCDLSLKFVLVCNLNHLQNLARSKGIVKDWLTVTNWVPPVNAAQGHSRLPKRGNHEGPMGQVTEGAFEIPYL